MDTALLLARLLLAGIFAVSAVSKLVDRAGSRTPLWSADREVALSFVMPVYNEARTVVEAVRQILFGSIVVLVAAAYTRVTAET